MKTFLITFGVFFCVFVNGQSIKKVYKQLAKENYETAQEELNSFVKSTKHHTGIIQARIAQVIIDIHTKDNSLGYDLLDRISKVSPLSNPDADFLEKQKISLKDIKIDIYKMIYAAANYSNTEYQYYRALEVCSPCFYKDEFIIKMDEAAYQETLEKKWIKGYEYFLEKFPKSTHKQEVELLLHHALYKKALNNRSQEELSQFLIDHKNSPIYQKVSYSRDSLTFSSVSENYYSYKKFIKEYPKSSYRQMIESELPQLMLSAAKRESSLKLFNQYRAKYASVGLAPTDKQVLEAIYDKKLANELSPSLIQQFKRDFPNHPKLSRLEKTLAIMMEHSDLKKDQLKGQVESLTAYKLVGERETEEMRYVKSYTPTGLYSEIYVDQSGSDELEERELRFENELHIDNSAIILRSGYRKSALYHCQYNAGSGAGGNLYKYYYSNGRLTKIESYCHQGVRVQGADEFMCLRKVFTYDASGNKIVADAYHQQRERNYNNTGDIRFVNKIKYGWNQNNQLIKKSSYSKDGERMTEYEVEYNSNEEVITYDKSRDFQKEIILNRDKAGRITSRLSLVRGINLRSQSGVTYRDKYLYKYDSNNRIIEYTLVSYKTDNYTKESREDKRNTFTVARTKYGDITSITDFDKEYEYTYDHHGNWITRTEFKVTRNDYVLKKKTSTVYGEISYY